MQTIDMALRAAQLAKRAFGRARRALATLPETPEVRLIGKTVRFEHKRLSFLNEEDMRAMFTNSYEITLCDFLRKTLREGDVMLDVGSNIGYIAAIAASRVGTSGQVHGFEPLPQCFERLAILRDLNPSYDLRFNNIALGDTAGVLPISFSPDGDSRNASLVPGKNYPCTIQVPVRRLDDYIFQNIPDLERIRIIKIDVEGFEFSVLRGMAQFFARTAYRPALVCEIKPWEVARLGFTLDDFDRYMTGVGYKAVDMISGKSVRLSSLQNMETLLFRG